MTKTDEINGAQLRGVMLAVIDELSRSHPNLQAGSVLQETARRLGVRGDLPEQAILTFWHDLFRNGYVAWGHNLANPNPPFCHLTVLGRRALQHFSRDPANPDGYLVYVRARAPLNDVAESYLREGLATFNAGCHKAAAVMVGVAAESLVLSVRDCLVARMDNLGHAKPADLTTWIVARVLSAISTVLAPRANAMPRELAEAFASYWPAFTQMVRSIRNDAGHPKSVDPVEAETVHAALLLFPELASLAATLGQWIPNGYV